MDYNPYGSYLYPPHPPPPPYYNQGQWQNPGRFEENAPTQGGGLPARDTPASATVAANGTNNDTTRLQQQVNALQEEIAQLKESQNRPPRYNPYRSDRYENDYQRSYRPRYDDNSRDHVYNSDRYRDSRRDYERGSRYHSRHEYRRPPSPYRTPYRTQLERDQGQSRRTPTPATSSRELTSSSTAESMDNNNRSIASSVHAPVGAPTISVTPTAISAHSGEGQPEFDDILYPTQDELYAAASLFNYGPADPIHPDFSWANDTGALIVTGETAQLIARKGGPELVAPIRPSDEDPAIDRGEESAVTAAEKLIERAMQPGNFEALWEANHLTMRAERTLHLEKVLGISRGNTTLPARLDAHLQMAKEHQFAWSFRPNLVFSGVPRDTSEDNPIPHPHLANPSLDDPAETHALWLLVHGDPVNFPGVLCTQSGHVDLATVRAHLLLRRLLKGIVGEQATYTERQRIVKRNFTSHFLDIATIPYFYGQKLTELGLVTEQHISFKTSTSAFELLDEVVHHLAECGVSADDMGEAYYWGQQAVLDFMQKHNPGTKEYLRYQRLFKRAAARLQFTNTPIVANRTWVISPEWDMKDIIAEKRRRIIQYEYDQQRVRGDDHWRFARNGITRRNRASGSRNPSMNQMVQGISDMSL
ncbi:hypothetical protein F5880DRAFT_1618404 [Lentinula raphanica]|nr:hypothetical protein F5880DRAFT_1618404 [Lentinula raphanica]